MVGSLAIKLYKSSPVAPAEVTKGAEVAPFIVIVEELGLVKSTIVSL